MCRIVRELGCKLTMSPERCILAFPEGKVIIPKRHNHLDYVDGQDLEWIRSRFETSHLKGRPAFEGGHLIVPVEAEVSSIESHEEKLELRVKG